MYYFWSCNVRSNNGCTVHNIASIYAHFLSHRLSYWTLSRSIIKAATNKPTITWTDTAQRIIIHAQNHNVARRWINERGKERRNKTLNANQARPSQTKPNQTKPDRANTTQHNTTQYMTITNEKRFQVRSEQQGMHNAETKTQTHQQLIIIILNKADECISTVSTLRIWAVWFHCISLVWHSIFCMFCMLMASECECVTTLLTAFMYSSPFFPRYCSFPLCNC